MFYKLRFAGLFAGLSFFYAQKIAASSQLESLFASRALQSDIPEDATEYLNKIPGQKVSVEFVIMRSLQTSTRLKTILSGLGAAKAQEFVSGVAFDPLLEVNSVYKRDNNESATSSTPTFPRLGSTSVKLSKYFTTGTALSAKLTSNYQQIQLSPIVDSKYHDSRYDLEISQNLWKDAFGRSSLAEKKLNQVGAKATKLAVMSAAEEWFMGVVQLYYRAWVAQQEYFFAKQNFERRSKMRRATKNNYNRGTAEKPDYLQIQAVESLSKVQMSQKHEELKSIWRSLVVSLDLPRAWGDIDPVKIPMNMPEAQMNSFCKSSDLKVQSAKLEQLSLQLDSLRLKEKSIKSQFAPDLKAFATLGSNAINDSWSSSLKDSFKSDHVDWSVGLSLTMPLGFKKEKAEYAQLKGELFKAKAQVQEEKDSLEMTSKNECSAFKNNLSLLNQLSSLKKRQKQRVYLEQKRFRNGRVPLFNVTTAEDDLTNSQVQYALMQANLQLQFWKAEVLNGNVKKRMGQELKL